MSIVMPAHNEESYLAGAVTETVQGLRRTGLPFEVLVVENGSTDATAGVAKQMEADFAEVSLLQRPVADYGSALRAGFLAATGEQVVNFDVDLVDLAFLESARLVAAQQGAVVVVGSKRGEGAEDARPAGRRLVTAVFSGLLKAAFGLRVSDTHGLKLLVRAPVLPLVEASRFGADIFDTEVVLRAERAGLGVVEVPVTVADQRPSRTSIVRRIPRSVAGLARLRLALWQESAPLRRDRSGLRL